MKILPFLLVLHAVYPQECPYMTYEPQIYGYKRISVLSIEGLPTNLAYNYNTKSLYFILIDLKTLQNDSIQTKMDQYVLKDNELVKIDKINGQAVAVDENNNTVYVATDKGLFILDKFNEPKYLSFKNEDIVQLFKPQNTNDIYAIMYPENSVYTYDLDKNETSQVTNINNAFIIAVDEHKNIYYESESKYVKVLLNGFLEPFKYVGLGKNRARALAIDWSGNVILATNDGLYNLFPNNVIPTKFLDLDFAPSGLTFDRQDFYISTTGIIYKYSLCY